MFAVKLLAFVAPFVRFALIKTIQPFRHFPPSINFTRCTKFLRYALVDLLRVVCRLLCFVGTTKGGRGFS